MVECHEKGCGKTMKRKDLQTHSEGHSGPVSCRRCRKECVSKRAFRSHMSRSHRQVVQLDLDDTDDLGQVKVPAKYVTELLKKSNFKLVDESSQIAHDFHYVMPTIGNGFRDYVSYLSKQNEKYRVPHVVLESKTLANVMGAGPIFTKADVNTMHTDPSYDPDKQAKSDDYKCSGCNRAHLAVYGLNVKDLDDFANTFLYVNCAPVKGYVNKGSLGNVERTILLLIHTYNKILIVTATIFPDDENEVEYLKPNSQWKAKKAGDDDDETREGDDGKKQGLKRVGIRSTIAKIVIFRDQTTGILQSRGWEVPTSGKKKTAKSCEVNDVHALATKAKLDITFDMENDEILPRNEAFTDLTHRFTKVRIPPKKKSTKQSAEDEPE